MNKLASSMSRAADEKLTENGSIAFKRPSDSALLTLFGVIGALRSRPKEEIEDMFSAAYQENPDLATKMLFYCGDIRGGGLGERATFTTCLHWLAFNHPDSVNKNIMYVPFFNRFDTWYALVGTPCEDVMWRAMRTVWSADMLNSMNGDPITLLAKWMKSINTSSAESRRLAKLTIENLHFPDEKTYRKALAMLRARLHVVEKSMSAKRWDGINYAGVPSYAMKNYAKAFGRHDFERFNAYIASLEKGETKVNSATLFPYDLVKPYLNGTNQMNDSIANEQWKALPNYIRDNDTNILCMADVSGSMNSPDYRPMATSIGLSLYFAERTKGAFKNLYMTYTDNPYFIKVDPNDTLRAKVRKATENGVGYNTDLEKAFHQILGVALANNVPKEEMPKALIIISDGEIDSFKQEPKPNGYMHARRYGNDPLDFVGTMKLRFAENGYQLPKLVFFQAESRQNTFLTQDNGVLWVSGQSASVFKSILNNLEGNGYEMMLETLNDERYSIIKA